MIRLDLYIELNCLANVKVIATALLFFVLLLLLLLLLHRYTVAISQRHCLTIP